MCELRNTNEWRWDCFVTEYTGHGAEQLYWKVYPEKQKPDRKRWQSTKWCAMPMLAFWALGEYWLPKILQTSAGRSFWNKDPPHLRRPFSLFTKIHLKKTATSLKSFNFVSYPLPMVVLYSEQEYDQRLNQSGHSSMAFLSVKTEKSDDRRDWNVL